MLLNIKVHEQKMVISKFTYTTNGNKEKLCRLHALKQNFSLAFSFLVRVAQILPSNGNCDY